jgi:IS30 family transposase|tara:strand:- start:44 stop:1081 length:1038 start_codon:yes stop_codon:yes gene_type:complete
VVEKTSQAVFDSWVTKSDTQTQEFAMPYQHFTLEEREVIAVGLAIGESGSQIARELDRHRSSISAEIERNSIDGNYSPSKAQALADDRRRESKSPWKMEEPEISKYVKGHLKRQWSPEQIAGRMKTDHPNDSQMRVSHETIYGWIREDKQQGGKWCKQLRQGKRKRRKRYGTRENRGRIKGRVGIELRPKEVDEKQRLGDWEGDTVEGAKGSGYLTTMVERKSQYLVLGHSKTKQAGAIRRAITHDFRRHGDLPCETVTLDNGKEFAEHKQLGESLGGDVYFAKPYHSWERGLNENTNGLLRQYFPKGMDFRKITRYQLKKVESELNARPRKTLGYRTPQEVMRE